MAKNDILSILNVTHSTRKSSVNTMSAACDGGGCGGDPMKYPADGAGGGCGCDPMKYPAACDGGGCGGDPM